MDKPLPFFIFNIRHQSQWWHTEMTITARTITLWITTWIESMQLLDFNKFIEKKNQFNLVIQFLMQRTTNGGSSDCFDCIVTSNTFNAYIQTNKHVFNRQSNAATTANNLLVCVCITLKSATTLAKTIAFRSKSLGIISYFNYTFEFD